MNFGGDFAELMHSGMWGSAAFASRILAGFEVAGVERWDDSAAILGRRFEVAPLQQWGVPKEGDAPPVRHRLAGGDA